jgi:hypothetical protein
MNYSIVGADRNTHLKIFALAIIASLLVGVAFNASLFAAPIWKRHGTDILLASNAHPRPVCRLNEHWL